MDPAFQGAGQRIGTEIWRIENFQPVPLPESEHGKFFSGDSYIILRTSSGKGDSYLYDIHFWVGKDSSQDEGGTAAIKTVELDAILGGRAVQHRELQGHESDKFLSYFKPCIVPQEGGVASGFKKYEEEKFEIRLYICRGKRVVKLKQVPFTRSSLNHDDVFILDTENKIYQFNGANSNIQERAKALEVIQFFKDKYHEGKCEVAIVDDGKLQADSDSGEFWVLFGGFAPIAKKVAREDDMSVGTTPGKLYSFTDGQVNMVAEDSLSKAMLENEKCYLLDCGAEIFVWVGRVTPLEDRKAAGKFAEEFIANQNRPKSTRITQLIQGYETHSFKSNFETWPMVTGTSGAEEGRGKVSAFLKQQGAAVKGMVKGDLVDEDVPPLLEAGGKIEVWHIDGSTKTKVSKEEIGKFYSGDSYIVLYTYHMGEKKEEYFLCCWMGKESVQEDQMMATQLSNAMHNSLKGRPVQGRVIQGKEPPQFIAIFNPMVILKGGLSSGYKRSVGEKGLTDATYNTADGVALFQISGASVHNSKVVQVDAVATALSSTDCFILQSGSSIFTWHGNTSSFEQQQLAAKTAEFLKPGVAPKHAKEGTESSTFWFALGGKQTYTSKKPPQDNARDPHLYTFSLYKGKFKVTEIFNFSQDDLLTEDMLILDTHAEIFLWVGQSVDPREKSKAFEIGQKYIELGASLEGLSPDVPLYKVTEGNEPCFFTIYFSWDSKKATIHGNSFEKKLLLLFGTPTHISKKHHRSNGSSQSGPTQRASAMAALNSAFNPSSVAKASAPRAVSSGQGSQRAAAVAALSGVLTAEQKKAREASPARFNRSSLSTEKKSESPYSSTPEKITREGGNPTLENNEESPLVRHDAPADEDGSIYSYEQLKGQSTNPAHGIDLKRREAYLSDTEFQSVLRMTKEGFYQQPKWKQDLLKKKVDLF